MLLTFEKLAGEAKRIYNIDITTEMHWDEAESNDCPASVIQNCSTNRLSGGEGNDVDAVTNDGKSDSQSEMARDAQEHGVAVFSSLLSENSHEDGKEDVLERQQMRIWRERSRMCQKSIMKMTTQTLVTMTPYRGFKCS